MSNYHPCVRIGNWFEEVKLEEESLIDFLEKRDNGELNMQKSGKVLQTIAAPQPIDVTRDGYVHFGDKVNVYCKQQADQRQFCSAYRPRKDLLLALNFKDPTVPLRSAAITGPCIVSATPKMQAQTRNVFEIVSSDQSGLLQPLQYGQHFMFRTLPQAGGLFLQSDTKTFQKFARKSRHQEVTLVEEPSYMTEWEILYLDPSFRMEMEGLPVRANSNVVIRHCKTGQNLSVEQEFHIRSLFGRELEVSCFSVLDCHRVEKDFNQWVLRMEEPRNEKAPVTNPPVPSLENPFADRK